MCGGPLDGARLVVQHVMYCIHAAVHGLILSGANEGASCRKHAKALAHSEDMPGAPAGMGECDDRCDGWCHPSQVPVC